MIQHWHNFDICIPILNDFNNETSTNFDAVFISTRSNPERLLGLFNQLLKLEIASHIFVIPTSEKDIPSGISPDANLNSKFYEFINDKGYAKKIKWDLPYKRNFAINYSVVNSYEKILLLDDDIVFQDSTIPNRLAWQLNNFWVSGAYSTGQIDTSVVGSVLVSLGAKHQNFVSGNCLGINIKKHAPFFPDIYNEDWLAILPALFKEKVVLIGGVTQLPRLYDEKDKRIIYFQEFGELIVDEIYSKINDHIFKTDFFDFIRSLIDDGFWETVILNRLEWFDRIIEYANDPLYIATLVTAKERLGSIRKEECTDFLNNWIKQIILWKNDIKDNKL
jgi:hypothetical protein